MIFVEINNEMEITMKVSLHKSIYLLENIDISFNEQIDFLIEILKLKEFLLFGFKYYYITLNNIDDIINKEIRKANKLLAGRGLFTEDFTKEENYKFVRANAIYENDFWFTGYERKLYNDPKTLWIKVSNEQELKQVLELNNHFVCVINMSQNIFQPELLLHCTETIDDTGADKDMIVFEEFKNGIFVNEILPLLNIYF